MKFFLKLYIIICLLIISGIFITAPNTTFAADLKFTPQIPIDGFPAQTISGNTLGIYIIAITKYATGIIGILATVIFMFGGVRWLAAGGNPEAISDAKSWIGASLIGLALSLCSFLLLSTINPALTEFKALNITPIPANTVSTSQSKTQSTLIENDPCVQSQAPYCKDGLSCINGKCVPDTTAIATCKDPKTQWVKTTDCSGVGINLADWNCTSCKGAKPGDGYKCCGNVTPAGIVLPDKGCCLWPRGSYQYTKCTDNLTSVNDCTSLVEGKGDYFANKKCVDITISGGVARKACQ